MTAKQGLFIQSLLFFIWHCVVVCDIYLHNPRGSNNRLDEASAERANPNRLFDSENNNRGGYNVGNMFYYENSQLQVEWTNQHSCGTTSGSTNTNCNIILQYMCSSTLRDGSDTRTIPKQNNQCDSNDCSQDYRYGLHEDYAYYQTCSRRKRNTGLYQPVPLNGQTAQYTRQNPNAVQSGTECSEERDYYPYWHPSPWIDIAILTDDISKCNYYQSESENVKSRGYCSVPDGYLMANSRNLIPNNQMDCQTLVYNQTNGTWLESPANANPSPVCRETEYTRDNHLGNTLSTGQNPTFTWTIPFVAAQQDNCVLRIRYNVTTNDYDGWSTYASNQATNIQMINQNVKLNASEATRRGYVLKTNPTVQIFSDLNFNLNLAINTAQFGRVFQDRSHRFSIRKRLGSLNNTNLIRNLNVRGKRGNIVQVFPAVEYDFVPNTLETSTSDYIHFQWTGSNTNPPNNAGEGVAGSDRSNIVLLGQRSYDKAMVPANLSMSSFGVNYPASVSASSSTLLGLDASSLSNLALSNNYQLGGSLEQLNDASPYFNLEPKSLDSLTSISQDNPLVYYYMCTRNNNFSNRDQKGKIIVFGNEFNSDMIGSQGGTISISNAVLEIPKGALSGLTFVRLRSFNSQDLDKTQTVQGDLASTYVQIDFNPLEPVSLKLKVVNGDQKTAKTSSMSVYRISLDNSLITKLNSNGVTNDGDYLTVRAASNGLYVAVYDAPKSNLGLAIGLTIAFVFAALVVLAIGVYLSRNPKYCKLIRDTRLGFKSQI